MKRSLFLRILPAWVTGAGLAACGADGGASPVAAATAPACTPALTVNLPVGGTAALTAEQARCFSLVADATAEYVLAGYDARALEASRAGLSAGVLPDPLYTIADATHGAPAPSAGSAARGAAGAAPSGHVRYGAAAAGGHSPFDRAEPWREGERFSVAPLQGTEPETARVVRVIGGYFVLAVLERDEAAARKVLEQSARALEFLRARGVPLLQSAFHAPLPATSAGSGQLLVLAAAWDPALGTGATWSRDDAGGTRSFVWLNTSLREETGEGREMYGHVTYHIKVLAHELTHAWQAAWLRETHGHASPGDAGWAVEGGADLVAVDLVRRYLNVGRASNWRWSEHLDPRRETVVLALEPFGAQGRVSRGYYDASSLLRDLQARLITAGMAADAALAEVSRGAVEGWHGADGDGGACAGLVERMRARLGAGWDPADAVLLWTAAQAADDHSGNPALNNPTYYDVGHADATYGWKPAGQVRAGTGQRATVWQVAGGSFHVRVRGSSAAGVLAAASDASDARWMIARVR